MLRPTSSLQNVIQGLSADWERLTTQTSMQRVFRRWKVQEPDLSPIDSPADFLPYLHQAREPQASPILAALIRIHATDPQAGRFILQALLPGIIPRIHRLRLMAHSAAVASFATEDVVHLCVSELWMAIAEFNLERNPDKIASNLIWRAYTRTRQELNLDSRELPLVIEEDIPYIDEDIIAVHMDEWDVMRSNIEALLVWGVKSGNITAAERDLVWNIYKGPEAVSLKEYARAHSVSYDALRKRLSRVTKKLSDGVYVNDDALSSSLAD